MKFRITLIAGILLLISGIFVASNVLGKTSSACSGPGQGREQGREQGHERRHDGPPDGHFFHGLNLTTEQENQIKAIHEAERTKLQPIFKQLEEAHTAMEQATANGQFDEAKVRAIATTESQAHIELAVSRARTQAAVFKILTPEQKTKLNQFRENRKEGKGMEMERGHRHHHE